MENIIKIFKNSFITFLIVLFLGAVFQNKNVLIGFSSGCLMSILILWLIWKDTEKIIFKKNNYKKTVFLAYLKRYFILFFFLGFIIYFFGINAFILAFLGLLNVKVNLILLTIYHKLVAFRNKHK